MIKVNNISKKLKGFELKDVSFELSKGYIMGLVGANGAGKTTILKLIMGLYKMDSGEILLDGKKLSDDESEFKNKIGFVYDELNFPRHLMIWDYKSMMKKYYKNFNESKFDKLLSDFGLTEKKVIGHLSKGQGVKLMICGALSHGASLIILDEPTSGLDLIARRDVLSLLQKEIEDGECSVIFSTHITSDLDGVADYLTLILDGEVVFSKECEEIRDGYRIIRGDGEELKNSSIEFISLIHKPYYSEGLFIRENKEIENSYIATIEDILFHYVRGNSNV